MLPEQKQKKFIKPGEERDKVEWMLGHSFSHDLSPCHVDRKTLWLHPRVMARLGTTRQSESPWSSARLLVSVTASFAFF
jgi:hypothetical protein